MTTSTISASAKIAFDDLFKTTPIFIDVAHHEAHEGDMYSIHLYDEDAASDDVIQIHIETPAVANPQKRAHAIFEYESSGAFLYQLLAGVTRSSGGASTTPKNRNQGSSKTSSCTCFTGSDKGSNTISFSGGTEIDGWWSGAGKQSGSGDRGAIEWILAPATEYLFQITSKAAGIKINQRAIFYEHTDG